MVMIGADPEQLAHLGRTMRQQMGAIEGMVRTVSNGLAATAWTGPARQRFENEWNQSFKVALQRLVQAFEMAGGDCLARSDELRRVMGHG